MTKLLTAEFGEEDSIIRTATRDKVMTFVAGAGNESTGRSVG
ncbi:hypothetical protein [Frankia nepalensis]|nr:hypothetical protein [Frankia nepalensis]